MGCYTMFQNCARAPNKEVVQTVALGCAVRLIKAWSQMMNGSFAALLLAGGKSQRMGRDKALLEWQGQPLWRVQLAKLRALKPERLLIACRAEQRLGDDSDIEWLFDPPSDESGPMGAICRALNTVQMPLLVLAVDMPQMTTDFLRTHLLFAADRETGLFIATERGPEPMAAIYAPLMLEGLTRCVDKGRLSLQRFVSECTEGELARMRPPWPGATCFFSNANTPTDWRHEKDRSD
ncbi:MAG: molybdenum cofactor guanylyltransferase [Prosthecobacter sp.]